MANFNLFSVTPLVGWLLVPTLAFTQARGPVPELDPRDLSGIWMSDGYRVFNEELSVERPLVFTAWGEEKFNSHKTSRGPRAIMPALGNDPIGQCDPMGVPRILLYDTPTEFLQLPDQTIQFFERSHKWRTIWEDGRELPEDAEPTFHGHAVGRWEGDTFVVESVGFDERTWLDQYGSPHSDEMRLEERWRRADEDTLELNMTIYDSTTYTKTLQSGTQIFTRLPGWEIAESPCVPSEEAAFNRRIRDPAAGLTEP